ncbi:MAG: hypothetical protein ACR2PO_11630 [Methyloligellaceae bacterium]
MKLIPSLAAASVLTLGLSALPQTASALPSLQDAVTTPTQAGLPIQNVSGYDGYGFGIHGNGCGWGMGGGTGYTGCFIYERSGRDRYGYRTYEGNGYRKPYYGRRGTSRGGYGRRGRDYRRGY